MRLLLDTHIWLWSLLEPQKLNRRVVKQLKNEDNELWLSPISIWELLILCEKKRLELDQDVDSWVERALTAAPLHEAPIAKEVALETRNITLPHRDPADRFLVASAKVFQLTLVTGDERLMKTRDIPVLANR
jgi:PIN domain nuclease of toxin-antitoxin system